MNFLIIAAGGKGVRFQSDTPKQLLLLKGRTVLAWTLQSFLKSREVDEIIVAYPQDEDHGVYEEILKQEKVSRYRLVKGGDTRYRSVRNAFDSIDKANKNDLVLIHDAARPLLPLSLLKTLIETAVQKGSAVPIVPLRETIKEVTNDQIIRTIRRDNLFAAQTPQVFQYRLLKSAYSTVDEAPDLTDESILLEKAGISVAVVKGEQKNMKITEREDVELVEFYLNKGWE
ncbi:MAG TPA: 2-C-methyl-D-erythritol 4-phosphate cytidylyltransferase [Acidobacteriota bacterium]|nr:2-C-methyl-D-erythritol 4-phosphate cytidylyltransferase [Acidobacteriota bacterium]